MTNLNTKEQNYEICSKLYNSDLITFDKYLECTGQTESIRSPNISDKHKYATTNQEITKSNIYNQHINIFSTYTKEPLYLAVIKSTKPTSLNNNSGNTNNDNINNNNVIITESHSNNINDSILIQKKSISNNVNNSIIIGDNQSIDIDNSIIIGHDIQSKNNNLDIPYLEYQVRSAKPFADNKVTMTANIINSGRTYNMEFRQFKPEINVDLGVVFGN